MKILVVGGSGKVAAQTLPGIKSQHQIHIFDTKPPFHPDLIDLPFTLGDVCDPGALDEAARGQDALLFMAMGVQNWNEPAAITTAFDSSVKGLYIALLTAHKAGIKHAVYTSSMSIYEGDLYHRRFADEDITPDSIHLYGFTKWLGEEVCRNAARAYGMSVNALRLCLPVDTEAWKKDTKFDVPTIATASSDVARAIDAALQYQGGFQTFMISGDYSQKLMNMSKAKRLLGWEPLERPAVTNT